MLAAARATPEVEEVEAGVDAGNSTVDNLDEVQYRGQAQLQGVAGKISAEFYG